MEIKSYTEGWNNAIDRVLELMRDINLKDTAESYSFRLKKKVEKEMRE